MVQSDALSRRPDHCPNEDNDNDDIIVLPNDMFVNLIDTELQRRIAESDNLDENAPEALKLLLENGFTTEIKDWEVQSSNGRNALFYRGKNYIPRNDELRRDIVKLFHNHETAGKLELIMPFDNTIGGLVYEHS